METANQEVIATVIGATLLLLFFAGVVIAAVVLYRKRQRLHRHELQAKESAYQNELLILENEVQEATLGNVARELHDLIGHRVAVAKLHLTQLRSEVPESVELQDRMNEMETGLSALMTSVRSISRGLSADLIMKSSLEEVMQREIDRIERTGNYVVHSDISDSQDIDPDPKVKLVLVRIIQEGISNVIHHAKADALWIDFKRVGSAYTLSIRDNGRGMDQDIATGLGISSMQQRAVSIGGAVEVTSANEGGTVLRFNLVI